MKDERIRAGGRGEHGTWYNFLLDEAVGLRGVDRSGFLAARVAADVWPLAYLLRIPKEPWGVTCG